MGFVRFVLSLPLGRPLSMRNSLQASSAADDDGEEEEEEDVVKAGCN